MGNIKIRRLMYRCDMDAGMAHGEGISDWPVRGNVLSGFEGWTGVWV
jgi:hypothetical protein